MLRTALLACSLLAVSAALSPSELGARFPPHFKWGTATASYQIEGAIKEDGRVPTIWDAFCAEPGKVANGSSGAVADDSYHRYDEDAQLLQNLGVQTYRLSLAWSRLQNVDGSVNAAGVAHYARVLDALQQRGIEVLVTLYHWDLPLQYSDMQSATPYRGWLNESIVPRFVDYARIAFDAFGARVPRWTTFNEPLSFCQIGYGSGAHAPGRCSDRKQCAQGDSAREPYLCTHSVLLAHAATVELYRSLPPASRFAGAGEIGITLNTDWAQPLTASVADTQAALRHLEFQAAWFADPIFFGDYPASMRSLVSERLPAFTEAQKQRFLRNKPDYYAVNYYTARYVRNADVPQPSGGWNDDQACAAQSTDVDGNPIGVQADSSWLFVVPWGFRPLLSWISQRYGNPPLYVTENGVDVPGESALPVQQALNDTFRVDYYSAHVAALADAIQKDGVDVRGYYAWSLLDNFEWADGYSKRFGLHYVDYGNNITRTPKASAAWYKALIAGHQGAQ